MSDSLGCPPESELVPIWPPGLRARAGPGIGSVGSAGAEPAAADWNRWCGASGSSSLCRLNARPGFPARGTCRDLGNEISSR